ncbi:MAG: mechanosensitive ion channel family protein [Luteibaculaceae bacterium]
MIESFYKTVEQYIGLAPETQLRIAETLFLFFVVTLFKYFAGKGIYSWKTDAIKKIQWRRGFNIVINIIFLIILIEIWFGFFGNVGTIIGFASAGIAIALRDPLSNLAGWLYLEIRKPFKIGDRIQIGEHIGDVVDVRFFDFSMVELAKWVQGDQPTGRIMIIPNSRTFILPVANYTTDIPLIWNEINFEITYESNPERAMQIVAKVAKDYIKPLSPFEKTQASSYPHFNLSMGGKDIYSCFLSPGKNGTLVSLRFICRVYKRRIEVNDLWKNILAEIAKDNTVQIAYETTRFFNLPSEGKSMYNNVTTPKADKPDVKGQG